MTLIAVYIWLALLLHATLMCGSFENLQYAIENKTRVCLIVTLRVLKSEGTKTWFRALLVVRAACRWYQLTGNVWLVTLLVFSSDLRSKRKLELWSSHKLSRSAYHNFQQEEVLQCHEVSCDWSALARCELKKLSSWYVGSILPSVLWHCWLGSRKGIRPVKNWAVGCWRGHLSGAMCRLAYGPADSTATHCLLLQ